MTTKEHDAPNIYASGDISPDGPPSQRNRLASITGNTTVARWQPQQEQQMAPKIFKTLNDWRDTVHVMAAEKGWHNEGPDPARLPTLLCLVHSEVSEVLEDYRAGLWPTAQKVNENGKPYGIPSELADVIIRVLDICGLYGIDIEKAVTEKLEYNATRPYRHGGKKA